MGKRAVLLIVGATLALSAGAQEKYRARLVDSGMGMAAVVGAADYCSDGQPLYDLFVGSLPRFGMAAKEVDELLAAMDKRRREIYADIATSLAGAGGPGQCPPELDGKVNEALRSMEDAWRRAVRNELGVELPATAAVAGKADAAGKRAASPPPPPPASAGRAVPPGKYACYTFDAGQLNYAYTDILVAAGGRYSVGRQGGAYTLADDGTLRFSGPLANAGGRFAIKNSGKPQIDLVFNGDRRASMACMKSG